MNKEFEGKYAVVTGGAGGISYEAAEVIAFLASDASKYITGQGIDINGGSYMN